MADIAVFIYLLQQLGLALGLGAATFSMMFYVVGCSDGTLDPSEQRFIKTTNTVLFLSLFLIIISGGLITGAHALAGEMDVISKPVYLGKWALLLIIAANSILLKIRAVPLLVGGAISGASWYALFIVNTLVPDVSGLVLGVGYVLWFSIFLLGFLIVKKGAMQEKNIPEAMPAMRKEEPKAPQRIVAKPLELPKQKKEAPNLAFSIPTPVVRTTQVQTPPQIAVNSAAVRQPPQSNLAKEPIPPIEFDLQKSMQPKSPAPQTPITPPALTVFQAVLQQKMDTAKDEQAFKPMPVPVATPPVSSQVPQGEGLPTIKVMPKHP